MRERIPWPFVLAALAALVQVCGTLAVRFLYHGAFDVPAAIGEGAAVRTSYAVLLVGGLLSGALAVAGAYTTVLRLGPVAASLLVLCVYAPIVLVAATALYGALVLLAIV
jgi:hypothetical protein